MSKPAVIFGDPEALLIAHLKAAFLPRAEAYKPATVSTATVPTSLDNATHVQVELEVGNADDYPVTERAQVRVTCYAPNTRGAGDTIGGRSDVKRLASLAQALVYSHPGDADVAGCAILIGRSDVITDPDTKNLMCWFLARVNLKATLLAS